MIAPAYGSAEWQRAKAHASFLALGLHCACGQGKQADEACCRGCVRIHELHGADGCFACREGRERHLGYLAGEVAQRAAAEAAPMTRLLDAVVASVAVSPIAGYEPCSRCDYLHAPADLTDGLCQECRAELSDAAFWDRCATVPGRGA